MPRRQEPEPQRDETQVADMMALNGPPSPITCPACAARRKPKTTASSATPATWATNTRPDSLLAEHGEAVEQALWSAVRVLEQHADLRLRMSKRAEAAGIRLVAEGFAEDSHNHHLQAQHIRRLLFGQRDRVAPDPAGPAGRPVRGRLACRPAPPAMAKKKPKPAPHVPEGRRPARRRCPQSSTRARRPAAPIPVVPRRPG